MVVFEWAQTHLMGPGEAQIFPPKFPHPILYSSKGLFFLEGGGGGVEGGS